MDDIDIEFSDEYIDTVAEKAIAMNIGARGIRSIIDNSLINLMYRAPALQKEGVIRITMHKYPEQGHLPDLVYSDGRVINDTNYKLYRGIDE